MTTTSQDDDLRAVWGPPADDGTTRRIDAPAPGDTRDLGSPPTAAPSVSTSVGSGPPPPPATTPPERTPGRRPGLPLRSYVAIALTAALGAGAVVVPVALFDDEPTPTVDDAAAAQSTASTDTPPAPVEPLPGATSGSQVGAIAERLLPSVVRIDVRSGQGGGSGSGVVLDATGNILTNAHVVEGARSVSVLTPDGEQLDAEVVGLDTSTDIAVVRVDRTGLPVPAFATGQPAVGDLAVAIGSPFGLDSSVTSGIVSGLNRQLSAGNNALFDLIQTDAAINPGNSGGALVNASGEVIGINTAILSASGANDGVGFAVPIETALSVADDLIEFGEVRAGWLGVEGSDIGPEVAELYELETDSGAVILNVLADSPAEDAGLEEGDIVVAVDDETVTSMMDLASIVRNLEPDQDVTLTVLRDGERIKLDLTLGTRPANPAG